MRTEREDVDFERDEVSFYLWDFVFASGVNCNSFL